MRTLKQSSTARALVFLLVDSTDHVTGKTGLTPTVTLSKEGAAFGAVAGAVSEIASGWYKVAGNATDTGTLGSLILHATGTAADPADVQFDVVAYDPQVALATQASVDVISAKTDNLPADPADASDIAASMVTIAGYIDTEVAAILAAIDTEVAAIKAKTDLIPAAPTAVGDIPTANANADALLDRANGVETSVTPRGMLRALLAALAGVATGGNTTTIVLKNPAGDTTRVTLTVDADGNRSASVLNV